MHLQNIIFFDDVSLHFEVLILCIFKIINSHFFLMTCRCIFSPGGWGPIQFYPGGQGPLSALCDNHANYIEFAHKSFFIQNHILWFTMFYDILAPY